MIFHPQNLLKREGCFVFPKNVCASAHPCLNKDVLKEFWHNFTFRSSELCICPCEKYVFKIGNAETIALEGAEYSINVSPDGVCVCGKDEKSSNNSVVSLSGKSLTRIEQAVDLMKEVQDNGI